MKESKFLEWKEEISGSFLKTVSAFANFGSGKILFGVKDNGEIKGIENPDRACLDIENRINDSISPKPDFSLSFNRKNGVITLEVKEGLYKPYFYKSKAYKRNDSSTVEVAQQELKRLILFGENKSFEELPSSEQNLYFEHFFDIFKRTMDLECPNEDVLKTLGFFTKGGEFNHAAALFADKNSFSGIDIIRFGDSINEILDRETSSGNCILNQYDRAINFFEKYYQYEKIDGAKRIQVERIPKEAFRETLANAIVHRAWDMSSNIRISMYPSKIEVFSPGGLPFGINEREYLTGYISSLRNPIIANVFFRLKLIEMFGTGIRRIIDCYKDYDKKPVFDITQNAICVILPTTDQKKDVTSDEAMILKLFSSGMRLSSGEILLKVDFGKNKAVRLLNSLLEKGYIQKSGNGRGTKYYL